MIGYTKARVRLDNSKLKSSIGRGDMTPPIHIKNYECINQHTPKIRLPLKKTNTSSSYIMDADTKSDNSFTTGKRYSDETAKGIIEGLRAGSKGKKQLSRTNIKQKTEGFEGLSNKSFKNLKKVRVSPINGFINASVQRTKGKSVTKSEALSKSLFNDNNANQVEDSKQIQIIDEAMIRRCSIKGSTTVPMTNVIDDRKFSIMDVPGLQINIQGKQYNVI
jgi:hypothetical protein